MRHIHKINSDPYTIIVANEPLEDHITITDYPQFYEISNADISGNYQLLNFVKDVPQMVSLAAFKSVLILSNLFTDVENALQGLQEPTKTIALVYWDSGNFVERYSQTVLLLQNELSLTDEQVDNLFTQANNINI